MDLKNVNQIENATSKVQIEMMRLGVALLFLVAVVLFTGSIGESPSFLLIVAAMIGGYMAMNIGANDVANNVGPAVGSKALSLMGAIIIAAIFEAAGAIIAGGEVVGTIRKGIIDPSMVTDLNTFIWLMMAALLAGAIWLNLATAVGAPVSTTHSIVGGVLGAGIAAGGWAIANWSKMGAIAASWVISPVMGGAIAAFFLYVIKRTITYRDDMIAASKKMVPLLVSIMAWAFGSYLVMKGLKKIWKVDIITALGVGFGIAVAIFFIVRPLIAKVADKYENSKVSVNRLFTIPLIFAAALLSFAHGANDVANAIGPLAAINDAITTLTEGGEVINKKASIPLWVMIIGAVGISIGLALYGPKLIRTVGTEITELDQMRAFCVAMAAAITVIIASQLGLPVSSTHIAVGGVFGIGFLREYLKASYARMVDDIKSHHPEDDQAAIDKFVNEFETASIDEKGKMLRRLKAKAKADKDKAHFTKRERKQLRKVYRQELVKRSHLMRIAAAWVITVPATAALSAMLFFMIRGIMLP